METFPTRLRPRHRLLVFARLPQTGRVKTRLAADLGDEAALAIYRAMLRDLLERLTPLRDEISIEILWTADPPFSSGELRSSFGEYELSRQAGEGLGERLQMAFAERFFFHEASRAIAIGVDDPAVDADLLRHAFALLESCEWVAGPASDGGYWLIGCRADAFRSAAFRDIPWGTDRVMQTTLERLRTMKRTVAILPERCDVDLLADLRLLDSRNELPPHTASAFREWAESSSAAEGDHR